MKIWIWVIRQHLTRLGCRIAGHLPVRVQIGWRQSQPVYMGMACLHCGKDMT